MPEATQKQQLPEGSQKSGKNTELNLHRVRKVQQQQRPSTGWQSGGPGPGAGRVRTRWEEDAGPQAFSFLQVHTLSLRMNWGQKPGQEELEAHPAGQGCTRRWSDQERPLGHNRTRIGSHFKVRSYVTYNTHLKTC